MPIAELDFDQCYRAVASRDGRFDGWFIVGVTSTGIYCRPSCPAPVRPKRRNVRFFPSAAAAQAAGLRACKRCLPDASPGSPEWDVRGDLTARAVHLIADGYIDQVGVTGLAERLAVSERHLRRLLVEELGAGPLQLARSRRAQTARVLIETTDLPFGEVAFAAGFASIRQFNDTIRAVFAAAPSDLRSRSRRRQKPVDGTAITVRLAFRPPLDWSTLLAWLAARAVPGIAEVSGDTYRRTLRLPRGPAAVTLRPAESHVSASIRLTSLSDLTVAVERCRRLLDLDADPVSVAAGLRADPALRPLVDAAPGVRLPGTVDGDELAVLAVLGQQISVAAARTMAGRLVAEVGEPLDVTDGPLTHVFPTAAAIADADLDGIGVTGGRQRTLRGLCAALAAGDIALDPGADRIDTYRRLLEIPGIGPWTASYVVMRALRDPDAFPSHDAALLRAAAAVGLSSENGELERRAERWRPWRAYAAQHLWSTDATRGDDR